MKLFLLCLTTVISLSAMSLNERLDHMVKRPEFKNNREEVEYFRPAYGHLYKKDKSDEGVYINLTAALTNVLCDTFEAVIQVLEQGGSVDMVGFQQLICRIDGIQDDVVIAGYITAERRDNLKNRACSMTLKALESGLLSKNDMSE